MSASQTWLVEPDFHNKAWFRPRGNRGAPDGQAGQAAWQHESHLVQPCIVYAGLSY
jgi:hypothetical protein